MPDEISSDYNQLKKAINLCASFLILRGSTIYFVHLSAKDFLLKNVSEILFPCGTEEVSGVVFSRSIEAMSALHRDMYGLCAPGIGISEVKEPDSNPLASIGYSCEYWIDHLCEWHSRANTDASNSLQDGGQVDKFLRTKFLYWLEALSLLRSMSQGVYSIIKLEGLLQVSVF